MYIDQKYNFNLKGFEHVSLKIIWVSKNSNIIRFVEKAYFASALSCS